MLPIRAYNPAMGKFKESRHSQVIKVAEDIRFPGEIERPFGLPEVCSDDDLMEAVMASMCGAELEELAPLLKVPPNAVRYWVGTNEWNALKAQVYPRIKQTVHTELCGVRSLAIRRLGERLRDGDPVISRETGLPLTRTVIKNDQPVEVPVYAPVSAANVAKILTAASDVLHELERDLGVVRNDKGDISLEELAEGLKRYAQAKDVDATAERVQ